MTGFARHELTGSFGQLTCELRSVNHRFLESGFRLPDELRGVETELRARLGARLKRGKIDCTIHLRPAGGGARELQLDPATVTQITARLRELAALLPKGPTVNLMDVLRWPGVIRDEPIDSDSLQQAGLELFDGALTELAAARDREGRRLQELIEQRCSGVAEIVAQLRQRLPELETRMRARLEQRVAELPTQVDPARIEQEVVLLLQRLDVAEELDRLHGHIEETRRVMGAAEPAGRRLDFLMQELNREANTLSSKSQDLDSTRFAVDLKVLIEQMREQVQNVE